MEDLSEEGKLARWRNSYLWIVAIFYFFQGIYYFGTGIYIAFAMGVWEVPVRTQSLVVAFIGIPTYLKIIPGILSDRMPLGRWGRRKGYILIGALAFIPAYAGLVTIKGFGPWWVAGILFVLVAWSLVDTALDALTVDITPSGQAARMQSFAQGGRLCGVGLASLAVPLLGTRLGWSAVLWLLCSFAVLQSIAALFLPEPEVPRQFLREQLALQTVIRQAFKHPMIWSALGFSFFFGAGYGVNSLVNIYLLSELGWSHEPAMMTVYAISNLIYRLAGVFGAILVMRIPQRYLNSVRFYAVFVCLLWIVMLPWLLFFYRPNQVWLIYPARILEGIGAGIGGVLLLSIAMRVCPKTLEGFTFALIAAAGNFGDLTLGTNTVTAFAEPLGGMIPALFVLFLYALISVFFLRPVLKSLTAPAASLQAV